MAAHTGMFLAVLALAAGCSGEAFGTRMNEPGVSETGDLAGQAFAADTSSSEGSAAGASQDSDNDTSLVPAESSVPAESETPELPPEGVSDATADTETSGDAESASVAEGEQAEEPDAEASLAEGSVPEESSEGLDDGTPNEAAAGANDAVDAEADGGASDGVAGFDDVSAEPSDELETDTAEQDLGPASRDLEETESGPEQPEEFVACNQAELVSLCLGQQEPVCGDWETPIQCFAPPCDQVVDFSNACAACATPGVAGYWVGTCEENDLGVDDGRG